MGGIIAKRITRFEFNSLMGACSLFLGVVVVADCKRKAKIAYRTHSPTGMVWTEELLPICYFLHSRGLFSYLVATCGNQSTNKLILVAVGAELSLHENMQGTLLPLAPPTYVTAFASVPPVFVQSLHRPMLEVVGLVDLHYVVGCLLLAVAVMGVLAGHLRHHLLLQAGYRGSFAGRWPWLCCAHHSSFQSAGRR